MQTAQDYFTCIRKQLSFETGAFINGRYTNAASGRQFASYNPATGALLAQVAECDEHEVQLAALAARRAYQHGDWSHTSSKHRKRVLLHFAALLERHIEQLAMAECLDTGKPIYHVLLNDMPAAIDALRWHAEAIDKATAAAAMAPLETLRLMQQQACGVVALVLPWSSALLHALWHIAPALACGNSVIVKPARQATLSTLLLGRYALQAGLPDGVLNIVTGYGETVGRTLGRNYDIDCLSFTGPQEIARLYLRYSAESNLKRLQLAYRDKRTSVVLPGTYELDSVAQQIAQDVITGYSESGNLTTTLLVHRSVKPALLDKLTNLFANWTIGSPLLPETRVGAMIEGRRMRRGLKLIELSQREGATLVYGGGAALSESGGNFAVPALLDDVSSEMAVMQEPLYCPSLCVSTFDDLEQAVHLAHERHRYPPAYAVYGASLDTAQQLAQALHTSSVSINCYGEQAHLPPGAPDISAQSPHPYTQAKSILMPRPDLRFA